MGRATPKYLLLLIFLNAALCQVVKGGCGDLYVAIKNILREKPAALHGSAVFNSYLRRAGIADFRSLSDADQKATLSAYVIEILGPTLANLTAHQDSSLSDALQRLGVESSGRGGYKDLEALSAKNVARISQKMKTSATSQEVAEELKAVTGLKLGYVHNTNWAFDEYGPLLSSHQIGKLGIRFGRQVEDDFNRVTLGTSDQLFFHTRITLSGDDLNGFASEYGGIGIFPDARFVGTQGWLSPFVMYEYDLVKVLKYTDPGLFTELERSYRKRHKRTYNESKALGLAFEQFPNVVDELRHLFKSQPFSQQRALGSLAQFSFTPEDYRNLVMKRLAISLAELRHTDSERYERIRGYLAARSTWHIERELKDLVFEPLGLPESYETKVPVAIPVDHFQVSH